MTDPIAQPSDVKDRINLDLDDEAIQTYLNDAAFENSKHNDVSSMDDDTIRQIEWRLAAIKILKYRLGSRSLNHQIIGAVQKTYESRMIRDLKSELQDYDPSGELGQSLKRSKKRNVFKT